MNAIIGHTGFVGGVICDEMKFDHYYNTQNISDMLSHKFDKVICCAPSGTKWKANQSPDKDIDNINNLIDSLKLLDCKEFILIGTIDINFKHPYGIHRKYLEDFVMTHFKNRRVYRLPGIFGRGLKKNVIFDLINEHELHKISLNETFQWYYLKDLVGDMSIYTDDINEFYTEPITTFDLNKYIFAYNISRFGRQNENPLNYNFLPHSQKFLYSRIEIMDKIKSYINSE